VDKKWIRDQISQSFEVKDKDAEQDKDAEKDK